MLLTPLACPSASLLRIPTQSKRLPNGRLLRIPTQSKGPAPDRAGAAKAEGRVTRPSAEGGSRGPPPPHDISALTWSTVAASAGW
ncbi:MAG: hypothetical protein QOD82_1581 [Pseudonocardiales bacterium]|nr:hypothetical protein [Pseudonocardiales bacterium]